MKYFLCAVMLVVGCTGSGSTLDPQDAGTEFDAADQSTTLDQERPDIPDLRAADLPVWDTPKDAEDDLPPPLDPEADEDGDGILNGVDNCAFVSNACQEDKDDDGTGDVCDSVCEEKCTGTICSYPGVQGCNCDRRCPSGYSCVRDTHYETGICRDTSAEYHRICAPRCTVDDACEMGTCIDLFGGGGSCICWRGGSITAAPCGGF